MKISVKEYRNAIQDVLSSRQIEILIILYSCPNSAATAKELTKLISPTSDQVIIANRVIGKIGKAICDHLGKHPEPYNNGHNIVPAYFTVVGPYGKSGWQMNVNLKKALESLDLTEYDDRDSSPVHRLSTETLAFDESKYYKEGKVVQVFVDRYERNPKARQKCIEHYGDSCTVCGFNFGEVYGETAQGVIQVHHLHQLSEIKGEYEVDPVNDLRPVCGNCHAVIHLSKNAFPVSEVIKMIKKAKARKKVDVRKGNSGRT